MWAILDKVVDDYAPVVAGIEDDIEEVEDEIFEEHRDATQRIYFLKREVIEFHRAVSPLLVPLEALERGAYATSTSSSSATSATSPTTPGASTSR